MADAACGRCGGSGWVIVERGGLSAAEPCECAAAGHARALLEKARIPPLYAQASLENFSHPNDHPLARGILEKAHYAVLDYAHRYPLADKPGLLLMGETGTGKTHLAVAALRILLERGFQGVFFGYQELLDGIRASYDAASGASDREAYRLALDADILLLDDLGAHRVSDWVQDIVTSIVTYRCNHRKALIATTNLPDPGAGDATVQRGTGAATVEYRRTLGEHIGERALSRLFEMCALIRIWGVPDYRKRKEK